MSGGMHIDQGIPSSPKVTFSDNTDRFSQLHLERWWGGDHEPDYFPLDGDNIIVVHFVTPFLILHTKTLLVEIFNFIVSSVEKLTVQFLPIKFLKYKAAANRVFKPNVLDATICSNNNGNPGAFSEALRDFSAVRKATVSYYW